MIKQILKYPLNKDILEQKSEDADWKECKELIQDLKDTLNNYKNGVGISAIQIGVPKKVCVIKINNIIYTLINPIITRTRGETNFYEGCLSAPDTFGTITRAKKVWCEYTDENGKKKEFSDGGLTSIIIQHELDHFDGYCKVFDFIKEDVK